MKSILGCVALVVLLLSPLQVRAHDGWIEAHPVLVEQNQPVSLFLMLGNHSNEHKSYRLAGKWEPQHARLLVIDPGGRGRDLTDRIVDLGEDAESIGPKGPKGFHLAPFIPADRGLHIVFVTQVRVLQFDGPKFQTAPGPRRT